jgi:ribosome-associated protein
MFTKDLSPEIKYKTNRSSGKGGQNVNKVSTKVSLFFNVDNSQVLSEDEKDLIRKKLSRRISDEGNLQVVCETSRSQFKNKELATDKFYALINTCFVFKKKRKPSKPSKSAIQKRLNSKKINSEKKQNRKFNPDK